MQMIRDAVSPERLAEFEKLVDEPLPDVAQALDQKARERRDSADERRDREDFEKRKAALARFEAEFASAK